MSVDPFTMLELDHRHVEALFEQLSESEEGPEREQLVDDLRTSLTAHMEFEEQSIYPLVLEHLGQETVTEAENEHGIARDGLQTVVELMAEPGFGAAVEALKGGITHHVEEEEGDVFPALRKGVDGDRQAQLAKQMLAAKRSAGLPVVPPEAPKAKLDELARDLGIEGRSSLNRDELIDAVSRAV